MGVVPRFAHGGDERVGIERGRVVHPRRFRGEVDRCRHTVQPLQPLLDAGDAARAGHPLDVEDGLGALLDEILTLVQPRPVVGAHGALGAWDEAGDQPRPRRRRGLVAVREAGDPVPQQGADVLDVLHALATGEVAQSLDPEMTAYVLRDVLDRCRAGELSPDEIHLPGIYVQRVLALTPEQAREKRIERVTTREKASA